MGVDTVRQHACLLITITPIYLIAILTHNPIDHTLSLLLLLTHLLIIRIHQIVITSQTEPRMSLLPDLFLHQLLIQ